MECLTPDLSQLRQFVQRRHFSVLVRSGILNRNGELASSRALNRLGTAAAKYSLSTSDFGFEIGKFLQCGVTPAEFGQKRRKGFFTHFIDNVKYDIIKNREMNESLTHLVEEEVGKFEETGLQTVVADKPEVSIDEKNVFRAVTVEPKTNQADEEAPKTYIEMKSGDGVTGSQNKMDPRGLWLMLGLLNDPLYTAPLKPRLRRSEIQTKCPDLTMNGLQGNRPTRPLKGILAASEMSQAVTEICKLEPKFEVDRFLEDCRSDIIPNVLEAFVRGDLGTLKDWCHKTVYSHIATAYEEAEARGYEFCSKVLLIEDVEVGCGRLVELGPVLVLNFTAQQIFCVKDSDGNVIEGDPEEVLRVSYVWALSRDTSDFDPKSAWRLLDFSAFSQQLLF